MKFVSQHFGGQSLSENTAEMAGLEEGLEFPDVDNIDSATNMGATFPQQNTEADSKSDAHLQTDAQTGRQDTLTDTANIDSVGQLDDDFEVLSQKDIT